jgi:hypothetical protein
MSQPAAPAATIVTTRFLNQFGCLSQRRQAARLVGQLVEPRADGLRSSSKNEAIQMERAASSPPMSTVKNVTTLAIIFALLIGVSTR